MRKIHEIVNGLDYKIVNGNTSAVCNGIALDSREIKPSYMFVAIKGSVSDGHQFIGKAIENGSNCILCERVPESIHSEVVYIQIDAIEEKLGQIAGNFYGLPSRKLYIVGVTGTNGKTTIATLLYNLFIKAGFKSGLISTVAYQIGSKVYPSTHTTPNIIRLNQLFAEMVAEGCSHCFMEVSSHALDQNRVAGIRFAGGIFTNLTHDHLDYHKTFRNYLEAKKKFFDKLEPGSFALTNIDDKNGMVMLQNTSATKYTYSCSTGADFKSKAIETHIDGTLVQIDNTEIWTLFTGKYNVSNLTAVYGASVLLGLDRQAVLQLISTLKPVRGRFETITINKITAIIDYAHTPDALENILNAINDIKADGQNVITVVGAGGDRDKAKRPVMAKLAVENSDKLILTSDNPRTEPPTSIIDDMERGVEPALKKRMLKITERREAIKTACLLAKPGDIILIAGKGHETYQEINGIRYEFDDIKVFEEQMKLLLE
jgi:UDP-N-acetylmuramoyl-L-alanyl-D-glutamate--2,6-diaminopimelate ligase